MALRNVRTTQFYHKNDLAQKGFSLTVFAEIFVND